MRRWPSHCPSASASEVATADYVTFTSSSTVRFLFEAMDGRLSERTRLVSIGPVTSQALRDRGREPDVEQNFPKKNGLDCICL